MHLCSRPRRSQSLKALKVKTNPKPNRLFSEPEKWRWLSDKPLNMLHRYLLKSRRDFPQQLSSPFIGQKRARLSTIDKRKKKNGNQCKQLSAVVRFGWGQHCCYIRMLNDGYQPVCPSPNRLQRLIQCARYGWSVYSIAASQHRLMRTKPPHKTLLVNVWTDIPFSIAIAAKCGTP